ncbi:MAG: MmcQ/YjbR family DNA-binding protein [bacterium]
MTYADIVTIALALPGVEESTSYGTPSLKVKGKFMARLKEDGDTLVLRVSFVVRDHLLQKSPHVFFLTDHYRGYPAVLVRMAKVPRGTVSQLLEDAWREVAPKTLVKQFDLNPSKPAK